MQHSDGWSLELHRKNHKNTGTGKVRMHRRSEGHRQIEWLEVGLKQLNNGEGLGFVIYGTVLDTRVIWGIRPYAPYQKASAYGVLTTTRVARTVSFF